MNLTIPMTVTDTEFVSSNILEDDYDEWDASDSYVTGNSVISTTTHRIYEAVQNSTGVDPTTDTDESHWIDAGATSPWRVFDGIIGDATEESGNLEWVVEPSIQCTAIHLFGLSAESVTIVVMEGSDELYNETHSLLDNTPVMDWWTYFYEPIAYDSELSVAGIPAYSGTQVTITVTGTGTTRCGEIVIGQLNELGTTVTGTKTGIEDFSRKERDAFGRASIVERAFADIVDFSFGFYSADARRIKRLISDARAIPSVWTAGDGTTQFATTVYGFPRNFDIILVSTNWATATIEIEGLV